MEIGAQFYTIRNQCTTLEGLAESLKKVSDIGYRTVQLSGVCEYDPLWMKEQLVKNGLRCVLTHTPAERIANDTLQVAQDHDALDCRCVGLGWYPFDENMGFEKFVQTYLPAAQQLKERGKYFMYHNHDQEFKRIDGRVLLDKLAAEFPADLMGFTLDTFWVQAGGGDPAQWLERLAGRIPCIHLKDYAYGRKMAVLGEGNINFDRVFEKAEAGGTQFMLVEQDDCNGEDPFECLRRSYQYLHAHGFR